MVTKLPILQYKGKKYFVDFRLEELRNTKTAEPIKFIDLKESKYSRLKKRLRQLRFRTWRQEYIRGVDD